MRDRIHSPVPARRSRLDDFSVFVEVAEAGSLTEAARRLAVPKSTVSRAVARLETALATPLLRRSARGHALSEQGQKLARLAGPHVAGLRDAELALDRPSREPHGTLRVTAPVDLGHALLAPLLPAFLRRHPGLRVETELGSRVVDLIAEGFDAALRVPATKLPPSALVARRLGTVDLWLYASPAYLARSGVPREPEDLAEHEAVILFPRDGTARWNLVGERGAVTVRVRGRLASNDFLFIRESVSAGAGVGAMPWLVARDEVAAGRLVRILPDHAVRGASLYLVYAASRPLPSKVSAFRDFLLSELPQLLLPPA